MSILFRVAAACALVTAAFPASATVVVDQPAYINGGGVVSSPFGAGYIRTFDDFRLAGNYTITGVSWHGGVIAPGTTIEIGFTTNVPPFYPDINLFSSQITTPTFTVTPSAPWEGDFSATLPTPVALAAGTDYWITIFNPNSFYWVWGRGDGSAAALLPGTAASYVATVGSPFTILQQGDEAFTLEGVPTVVAPPSVPEPLSLALFGAGLGFAGLRRRR